MTFPFFRFNLLTGVSTHMPLARHDINVNNVFHINAVSTHMPLARHDPFLCLPVPLHHRFLLTCLLRGMTYGLSVQDLLYAVSTHMPLARHDFDAPFQNKDDNVSTHMPLARHDRFCNH